MNLFKGPKPQQPQRRIRLDRDQAIQVRAALAEYADKLEKAGIDREKTDYLIGLLIWAKEITILINVYDLNQVEKLHKINKRLTRGIHGEN